MFERVVPEPFVVEPWWRRFGNTAKKLLYAVAQRPLDPEPRLVVADFLEEAGESDRAEFIRLQVQVMRVALGLAEVFELPPADRMQQLLFRHQKEWLAGLPEELNWSFMGGLVEELVVPQSIEDWLWATEFVDVRWVSWVGHDPLSIIRILLGDQTVGRSGGESLPFLEQPQLLERLIGLEIEGGKQIGDAGAKALANSPHLANLASLTLGNHQIGDAGVKALANSPHLTNLRILELKCNRIGDAGARALAKSRHLANLRTLNLSENQIRDAGAAALAESPNLANLRTLDLSENQIKHAGAVALAKSPHLTNLRFLNMAGNPIGVLAAGLLRLSPFLHQCIVNL